MHFHGKLFDSALLLHLFPLAHLSSAVSSSSSSPSLYPPPPSYPRFLLHCAVLFCLFCSACSVLPVLFLCLFFLGCPAAGGAFDAEVTTVLNLYLSVFQPLLPTTSFPIQTAFPDLMTYANCLSILLRTYAATEYVHTPATSCK
jgi:hypothetical protein